MINDNEEYVIFNENHSFQICIQSIVGNRNEQQDCSGYEILDNKGLIVVCDGMGGHLGGNLASQTTTHTFIDEYKLNNDKFNTVDMLLRAANIADEKVFSLKKSDGSRMAAGSTVVAVDICDKKMHWISVGDSRIYIKRDSDLVVATTSHIYKMKLDEQIKEGIIDEKEYKNQLSNADKLISFIGMGGLKLVDINNKEFCLETNDRILLTSDGLFKILSDDEILNVLDNFSDIREAARALITKTKKKGNGNLDNVTIAIIKIK